MVHIENGKLGRDVRMDPEVYRNIKEHAARGEFIDFGIPKDAPEGRRISEKVLGIEKEQIQNDLVHVNPDEIFK